VSFIRRRTRRPVRNRLQGSFEALKPIPLNLRSGSQISRRNVRLMLLRVLLQFLFKRDALLRGPFGVAALG
jgi:hypothetical protein